MKKSVKQGLIIPYSLKVNLTLKLTVIILVACIFSAQANGYSQNTKVTIELEQVQLRKVFETIESLTDFKFLYNNKKLNNKVLVSIKAKDKKLSEVLNNLFEGTAINFVVEKKQIVLKVAPRAIALQNPKSSPGSKIDKILQKTVSGVVTDDQGIPLAGANVVEKGTANGVIVDFDGNFSIDIANENSILVVSYIGFVAKEVEVGEQTTFNIQLEENQQQLDEVVVIGYGGVKKSDLTGSVASVSSEDLNRTVNQSFAEALEGRASGVKILNGEGTPGGDISVRIRGGTSVSASNEPLYVIDGFPVIVEKSFEFDVVAANAATTTNALSGIDPKDIESIQILKDASATAIYGSRGANGVVIITTKKGKVGKSTVSFETFISSQEISKKIDVLDAVEYATYQQALLASQVNPNADAVAFYSNPESFAEISKDWQDEIYRNALIKSYNLGLNGGSESIRYNISAGAFLNEGIIKESNFDRYNARVNLNGDISDRARFSAVLTGSYSEQIAAPTGGSNGTRQGIVSSALLSPPFTLNENDALGLNVVGQVFNPDTELAGIEFLTKSDFIQANLSLEYDLTESLTFKTLVGGTSTNQKDASFHSAQTGQGSFSGGGIARITHSANRNWLNENTLNFTKEYGDHNVSFLAGATIQKASIENFSTSNTEFAIDDLGFNSIQLGTNPVIPTSNLENWSILSGLARLNYGYTDKYLLTLSYRADGSSRFADGNKWGYFPAAALGWRISNEDFLKDSKAISNLKLRLGYGVTGNQEVPRFRSFSALSSGFYSFGIDNGSVSTALTPSRVANPDLTWETTKQVNVGVDFGFFNQRISGVVDVYEKRTEDMLLEVNLIPTAGIVSPALRNVGSLKNTGLEIALNTVNIDSENFSWTTDFNISFNSNEILNLGAFDQIFFDVAGGFNQVINEVILRPGESLGTFFGYETAGVYPEGATDGVPGQRIFVDQNDDGLINDDDRVVLGAAVPKHYGGFTNQFRYKGFDLSVFFDWSYGSKVYNANRSFLEEIDDGNNRNLSVFDAWTPTNQDTDIAALGQGTGTSRFIDRLVEDGSFIRLKNISLGYTFNTEILDKTPFSFLKVYISGQNIWTGTSYSGYNPEANTSPRPVAPGIDWGAYPIPRIYTVGLNVNF